MTIFPITVLLAVSAAGSSCPYGGTSLSSSVRAFYLTSATYNDSEELDRESKQLTGSPWAAEVRRACGAQVICDVSQKYRSFDGTCNNLRKPAAGSSGQCYTRILPASYVDGVSEPPKRTKISGIFNALQSRPENPSSSSSVMFATISQFVAHDIMQTALSSLHENFDCCASENWDLPECAMRIDTEKANNYENEDIECMSFLRAARCPCTHEKTRQSMNRQTAYVDLSHVYLDGNIRLPNTPYLTTSTSEMYGKLPRLDPDPAVCYAESNRCFEGDDRINQQQGLSLHHVVFERQHNNIAWKLSQLNPSWSSETVFHEARKILIARWQYVYCKEIILLVLDDALSKEANIHIDQLMEGTEVDPDVETVVFTESVHSEFRAHYLVPGPIGDQELLWLDSDKYFTDETFLNNLLEGQLYSPMNPEFPVSPELAQELLKETSERLGLSMVMIDIQRGRDTGVPCFSDMVAWAFNTSIQSFDDLAELDILSKDDVELLEKLYPRVEDIDFWVGGHLQKPYGSGVPYVHQKIRIKQHYGQIYGDRFFFSHRGVFSPEQREAIARSSSYSQILCEVLDLDEVPLSALLLGDNNTRNPCASFEPLDLQLWTA